MQYFQDSNGGRFWALDDDVIVRETPAGLEFFDPAGGQHETIPKTLVRVDSLPEPKPAVPQVVSRFQGREAMWQTEYKDRSLFEASEAIIRDSNTPAMYRRAWDELQEFKRDSEMLIAITNMLELTDEDLDKLFILAASIKV
ncbi:putative head-tail joining [Achromobacter phage ewik_TL4]|nr:hypothetical protein [Achromobacter phage hasilly_LB3]WNO48729.1 putative head-tail joining [Achromobacter phage nyaak_TL1]WNO48923.1 hypothetical protein [Achromobacter phage ewii_LB8]WNO49193.1 putative head-tail joining [Achromobacter phage ewik_TL4]